MLGTDVFNEEKFVESQRKLSVGLSENPQVISDASTPLPREERPAPLTILPKRTDTRDAYEVNRAIPNYVNVENDYNYRGIEVKNDYAFAAPSMYQAPVPVPIPGLVPILGPVPIPGHMPVPVPFLNPSAPNPVNGPYFPGEQRIIDPAPRNNQSQLALSAANGLNPVTLMLNLGPRTMPSTPTNVAPPNATFHKNIITFPANAYPGMVPNNHPAKSPNPRNFFVKIPLKQNSTANVGNGVAILRTNGSAPGYAPRSADNGQKSRLKVKPVVSRTTVVQEKSKYLRSKLGPLLALNYSLYDDNLIEAQVHESVAREKIAFGFPVKSKPWIADVVSIIAFLSTFKSIIQVAPLGPADFEEGLGLGVSLEERGEGTRSRRSLAVPPVSLKMDALFRKLLELVLNRKKPIARDGQWSALHELKSKYLGFGLPREWRDDSNVCASTRTAYDAKEDNQNMVDNSKSAVSVDASVEYAAPQELMNPFHESGFEKHGLGGIKTAEDRCIMIRSLVTWCMTENTAIKQYMADAINRPDFSGDRDTAYGSRAILEGFNETVELKKDLERRFLTNSKATTAEVTLRHFDPKYFDPASDPLEHPLFFRFNEFIVCDCGLHIGRFYLVRMADTQSGRVSSLEQMRNAVRDVAGVRLSAPSGFALYVEDVHSVLTESLGDLGVEFDTDGNEVAPENREEKEDESQHWYCVASTCEELEAFLNHLSNKLGISNSAPDVILPISIVYKPTLNMYHYLMLVLPLMWEYETMSASTAGMGRASRRKRVTYTSPVVSISDGEQEGADDDYLEDEPEEHDDEYVE